MGIYVMFFWLLTYYAFLSLGKALGDKGVLHPIPALWLPNMVVGGVAVHFFRKACRESPLRFQAGVETAFALTSRYFIRFKRNPKD
jgi:hypothetical protein